MKDSIINLNLEHDNIGFLQQVTFIGKLCELSDEAEEMGLPFVSQTLDACYEMMKKTLINPCIQDTKEHKIYIESLSSILIKLIEMDSSELKKFTDI